MWGLILKHNGEYTRAKKKFETANKYQKDSPTIKREIEMIDKMIEIDRKVSIDAFPVLKGGKSKDESVCARSCGKAGCALF